MFFESLAQWIRDMSGGELANVSTPIILTMLVVSFLLVVLSIVAAVISLWLMGEYAIYNDRQNSLGLDGRGIARGLLDEYGLTNIKVTASGSVLFGNSYSHYFKKVRLRHWTWKEQSVTSLAMAAQKSSLAVLDYEGDPDMKKRVRMTPIVFFGPLAFIPMVVIGAFLDVFIFETGSGICSILMTVGGLALYALAFAMSLMELRTEVKAQELAVVLMRRYNLATEEEIGMCQKLYRLYKIEYINNMIIALLEMVYRCLQIIIKAQSKSKKKD